MADRATGETAAVFAAGDPPRTGRIAFWRTDGEPPDSDGEPGELTVLLPESGEVRQRVVPARWLPVGGALRQLADAAADHVAHPAARFWGAAAVLALHLVARGRMLPAVSPNGYDTWRLGPLDGADLRRIRELAAAMPATARAVPVHGSGGLALADAESLLRGFLDAVADAMPRSPAAALVTGAPPFAVREPRQVPGLRAWAAELASTMDSGVELSLRMELAGDDPATAPLRAVLQVRSVADPTRLADAAELWATEGAAGFGAQARIETMVAVRRAARVWPTLERLLSSTVPDALLLGDEETAELLAGAANRLHAGGVLVHWPAELLADLTARAVIDTGESPVDGSGFFGGDELLRFDWQLALGGETLTESEMDALAEASRPVVRLRDRWVLADPELVAKARQRELKPLGPMGALGAALTGTAEVDGEQVTVAASGWLAELRERLSDPEGAGQASAEPPGELHARLRDYQLRGFRWLVRMTGLGLGCCLADDMGLGKTVTLIALHLHRQHGEHPGPTLVVCPASLLGNWEREIARFAPGVGVRRFHGSGRTLDGLADGFVLTTYGTMRLDADTLAAQRWGMVVADEAQQVKNPSSGAAKELRKITAPVRVALTGTPVENNLTELWAILDWTTPGLLGTLRGFRSRWAKPIEESAFQGSTSDDTAASFARLIRPFLLRRRKVDPGIAPELPAKTETDHPVALSAEQVALYEAVLRELLDEVRGSEGMRRRGLVVKLLTALKQICNHPAQYLKEGGAARLAGRSGKLDLLDELVASIVAADGGVLVFTQYVAMARLIERRLHERGVPNQLLHGGTPVATREEMVRRFAGGGPPVFLLSLKAAGTGLNLMRADHVVHYDRWWNPAVEEQATDRAYRIGQQRAVQVHRLVTEGTVEDRIAEMLHGKRQLADAVLHSGEAALTELSDVELADLVELRGER